MMRISLLFLLIIFTCSAKEKQNQAEDIKRLNNQVEILIRKNDSLTMKMREFQLSKNEFTSVVDKIDNLYNNNFDRFILFWGIIASVIVIGIPYYITQMQKRIIEIKKTEIFTYSQGEINKLEDKFSKELTQKYSELNDLVNNSNLETKSELNKEFVKTRARSLYIASKINEIDKNYDKVFENLKDAITNCIDINYFFGINFYLRKIKNYKTKFDSQNVELNITRFNQIIESLKILGTNEEIDQDLLNKTFNIK